MPRRLEEDVLNKLGDDGRLCFPRLRKTLTTRWGWYAWATTPFLIENHVIFMTAMFKGRPITDFNIQVRA